MQLKKTENKKDRLLTGFSLIELIVVIAVFLLIVLVAIDIFVGILRQQKRLLQEQELLNQTSYVSEYMSRALRMASKDEDGDCLGAENMGNNYVLTRESGENYNGVKFINRSNDDICQEFFLDENDSKLKEMSGDMADPVSLVSDSLQVNYFHVKIYGESGEDTLQPRVVFSMELQAKGSGDQPKKQIQTTISQRNLDEE